MSIQTLTKQVSVVFCSILLACVIAVPGSAKEQERDGRKIQKKQTTEKTEKVDRETAPANAGQTDRRANSTQDTVAPATKPKSELQPGAITPAQPQPTTARAGEQIKWQVIAGGGGINGTSTNYRLSGTVGQVAVGMGTSASYSLNHGFWQDFAAGSSPSCCVGETGDVNADGNENLTDLTLLVNQLFVTFVPVPCLPEANTSGDAACDLSLTDLTLLVNKLFVTFGPTALCTDFDNAGC